MKISDFGKSEIFFQKVVNFFFKISKINFQNLQNLKNSQFFINFKINFRNGTFQKYFFSDGFFSTIFFPVRIFWGCRFDAEIGPLSIYKVCRAIPALLHLVWSQFMHLGGCSRNIWGSYGLRKFLVYTKCYLLPKTIQFFRPSGGINFLPEVPAKKSLPTFSTVFGNR